MIGRWPALASTAVDAGVFNPSSVAVGPGHVCAAAAGTGQANRAQCWGSNAHLQLGRVGFAGASATTAADVNNGAMPFNGANLFSLGDNHSCFASGTATLFCFGERRNGQLGTSGTMDTAAVTDVAAACNFVAVPCPPPTVTGVAAGASHTCGLFGSQVWCTGLNTRGQTGVDGGADTALRYLQRVAGIPGTPVALAAADEATCTLTSAGEVWCWGDNSAGQLGAATPPVSWSPLKVPGLPGGGDRLSAGDGHFCLHTTADEAWCWGRNDVAQCGTGSASPQSAPARARF